MAAVVGLAARSLLLLLLLMNCHLLSGLIFPTNARMEPNGIQHKKEGERLEINCTLTNETGQLSCNASHMSIRLYPLGTKSYIVGTQTPIGPHSIRMLVERASTNESGKCYCYCNGTTLTTSAAPLQYIIGAPPHQPEITEIILENFEELVVYFDPVRRNESLNSNTTWSLTLTAGPSITATVSCSVSEKEYMCRTSNTSDFKVFPLGTNLTINAQNRYGSNSTERGVHLAEYVRLAPMAVEVEVNSTWAWISWTIDIKRLEMLYFHGIHYNMSFYSELFPLVMVNLTCFVRNYTDYDQCRNMRKKVDELQPYTQYNLTWWIRPVLKGYWSKPGAFQFLTLEDAPKTGPLVKVWLYSSVRQLDKTYRTYVYPQDLRPQDKAGVITAYEYQAEGWERRRREEGIPHRLPVDSYDPNEGALTVRLWACTKVACSQNSSTIVLPAAPDRVAGPSWLDVEVVNNSHYLLYWETQGLQASSRVQLHWCWGSVELQNQATLVACKTEISSREVDSTAANASLSVQQTEDTCAGEDACRIQFGVSVDRGDHSSGIIWNTCMYEKGKEPQMVSEVIVDSRKAPAEVTLTWPNTCSASPQVLKGRPVTYQSRIIPSSGLVINSTSCDKKQGLDQSSVARHGDNSHLYKTDLQQGESYLVCVRSLSDSLLSTVAWKVEQFRIDSPTIQSLVIGLSVGIPIIVIIGISSIFLRQRLKERKLPIITTPPSPMPCSRPRPDPGWSLEQEEEGLPYAENPQPPELASDIPLSSQQADHPSPQLTSQVSAQPGTVAREDLSEGSAPDCNQQDVSGCSISDGYGMCIDQRYSSEEEKPGTVVREDPSEGSALDCNQQAVSGCSISDGYGMCIDQRYSSEEEKPGTVAREDPSEVSALDCNQQAVSGCSISNGYGMCIDQRE